MGRAKQMRERRKRERKSVLPQGMPQEAWNVQGVSQHGEELSFNEPTLEAAETQAERIRRRGGTASVTRMLWSSPGANYFPEGHWRVREKLQGSNT